MNIWTYFDLLAPACVACGLTAPPRGLLCAGCRAALAPVPPGCPRCAQPSPNPGVNCDACAAAGPALAATLAACCYAHPVDALVRQLKFDGRLPVARALASLLLARVRRQQGMPLPDALVPVPLHPARERERGYNQAERIAAPVARALGIPLHTRAVQRCVATEAQSRMDLARRQQNLAKAFRVVAPLPSRVAIVDDVVTSGSTLRALADTLAAAGVMRVEAWVVARTL